MSLKPTSYHQENFACWLNLNPGQAYRLRVRAWENQGGAAVMSEGTLIFTLGAYDRLFNERGGIPKALKGVTVDVDHSRTCDLKLVPSSQRAMHLELQLQALNSAPVGETFTKTAAKTVNSTVRLTLSYARALSHTPHTGVG